MGIIGFRSKHATQPRMAARVGPSPRAVGAEHDDSTTGGLPGDPARSSSPPRAGARDDQTRLLLAGQQTLADTIAPAAVEITRDGLCIDGQWLRTLSITGYPRFVDAGWLDPLIELDEPFELSLHVQPLPAAGMVRQLSRRLVQLHSSRLLDERHGRLADPEREVAYRDIEQLRTALQRGDEHVFSVSLTLLVRAPAPETLDERCARLVTVLQTLQLASRPATLEHDLGLDTCLPQGEDRLRRVRTFDTSSVATAFPFSASELTMSAGLLYGVVPHNGALVILDPFAPQLENANQVVFAKSGAGKSYACKLQALRALLLGTEVVVVDPEEEYSRLCSAVGGQLVRLAPGSRSHLNPFDLPPVSNALERVVAPPPGARAGAEEGADAAPTSGDVLAEKVQALHALLDLMLADHGPGTAPGGGTLASSQVSMGLGAREKGLLDRALYETYRRMGITADRRTHDRPAPLLRDLYDVLRSGVCGTDTFGLADRLQRYVEGSLAGLFAAPTNVALDRAWVFRTVGDQYPSQPVCLSERPH